MEKPNSQHKHRPAMEQTTGLFACATRCGTLSITTPVSLLANELIVRSVLHRQVSLAAVNHTYVIHEAMNVCKNLKVH